MNTTLLKIEGVSRSYRSLGGMFSGGQYTVFAVRNVSLHINAGEIVGLVGESGSGKTTLARMIIGLERADQGRILLDGIEITAKGRGHARSARRVAQMVFQNPYGALNPMQRIDSAIIEPLKNFQAVNRSDGGRIVAQALEEVGLPSRLLRAYPYQLSGGERQRVCIARALVLKPRLLICDEAVSALDKTIQAQVLALLHALQQRYGLAVLFISHDLAVVNQLCDRLLVMCKGEIVEEGCCREVLSEAKHPYTQKLLQANRYLEGIA